ncbi:MAG: MHYT domain-containing protein, partial [Terriglobia bacterium]
MVAISLFDRARAAHGRARLVWIALDAAVSGTGIWATHFIAMLAYAPSVNSGYELTGTVLSLVLSIACAGIFFSLASAARHPRGLVLNG